MKRVTVFFKRRTVTSMQRIGSGVVTNQGGKKRTARGNNQLGIVVKKPTACEPKNHGRRQRRCACSQNRGGKMRVCNKSSELQK